MDTTITLDFFWSGREKVCYLPVYIVVAYTLKSNIRTNARVVIVSSTKERADEAIKTISANCTKLPSFNSSPIRYRLTLNSGDVVYEYEIIKKRICDIGRIAKPVAE